MLMMLMMVIMGRDRSRAYAWAAFACVLFAAAVVAWFGFGLRRATWGDVDPAGAVSAVLALGAVFAGRQSFQAWMADTDVGVWTGRLANAVLNEETKQREQWLIGQVRTIDVEFVFKSAPAHNAEGAKPSGSLTEVVDFFRNLHPQRLVITGEAGAGKTVLAIELILGLLRHRDADDPVPVLVPAAGWDPNISVQQWLTAHLVQVYRLRKTTAQALVNAYRVLPVIDGLDELDTEPQPAYGSRAGLALQALNGYQHGQDRARLVLTCRSGQYDALTADNVWARDAARVDLAPVSADKAWEFIKAVVGTDQLPRWQPILNALTQRGHALAAALTTPWRLTLAVTVYQQQTDTGDYLRDPVDLAGPADSTPDGVRDHLLSLFIPAVTAVATKKDHNPRGYRPDEIEAWLVVLARYLHTNANRSPFAGRTLSSTDLILHELWPLAGNRPRLYLTAALGITLFLAFVPALASARASCPAVIAFVVSVGVLISACFDPWPKPSRIGLLPIKAGNRPRKLVVGLAAGLIAGLVIGFVAGVAYGLPVGFVVWLMLGLEAPAIRTGIDPRDPIRNDLVFGLTAGAVVGLAAGLIAWPKFGLAAGLVLGVVCGSIAGLVFGLAGMRYLAFVVCMRGRLPWRLGRFLDWCYTHARLVRIAGIAYQFRHRELQDYLANRPTP